VKAPAFMFYAADWLRDTQLQMASTVVRGVWINALCRMWDAMPRGTLCGTSEELARICGCSVAEFELFLSEAQRFGFADIDQADEHINDKCQTSPLRHAVTPRSKKVTVSNRRMVREEKARQSHANRQARYRQKAQGDADVTVPSSITSSITSSKKEKNTSLADARFAEFWEAYPKKVDKQEAQAQWRRINPTLADSIIADAKQRWLSYSEADKEFIPSPARYLRRHKWTDEIVPRNGNGGRPLRDDGPTMAEIRARVQ
jgi:hypothetical protein